MNDGQNSPPAKLVWSDPQTGVIREFVLQEGCSATLGRTAENDVHIPERQVSRRHAVISCQDGRFSINDRGSTNGTFVNDKKVEDEQPLRVGDEVRLFTTVIRLMSAADKTAQAAGGEKASLKITGGPQAGQVFPLLQEKTYIGRSMPDSNQEVVLRDSTVSRAHAFLLNEEGQWQLFDLGSINGTAVNSQPVIDGESRLLQDGDAIVFGATKALFRLGNHLAAQNSEEQT